mmetsp:Transcript_8232/g.34559  ORF Transcript_8232/g.34559 Transcript_8232/m.34559 type:complete len:235 (+) Transcript_8232:353-1057(+)
MSDPLLRVHLLRGDHVHGSHHRREHQALDLHGSGLCCSGQAWPYFYSVCDSGELRGLHCHVQHSPDCVRRAHGRWRTGAERRLFLHEGSRVGLLRMVCGAASLLHEEQERAEVSFAGRRGTRRPSHGDSSCIRTGRVDDSRQAGHLRCFVLPQHFLRSANVPHRLRGPFDGSATVRRDAGQDNQAHVDSHHCRIRPHLYCLRLGWCNRLHDLWRGDARQHHSCVPCDERPCNGH